VLSLIPKTCRDKHLWERIEVKTDPGNIEFFVDELVLSAGEVHTIRGVERPVVVGVVKIDSVNHKAQAERTMGVKKVVFVAKMYAFYIKLDTLK